MRRGIRGGSVRFPIARLVAFGVLVLSACGGTGAVDADDQSPAPTQSIGPSEVSALPEFTSASLSPGRQEAFSFVSGSGAQIDYLLYVPSTYDDTSEWPLILFLHWNLGREWTLESLRRVTPLAWYESASEFPFLLVAPMAPPGPWSGYHDPVDELLAVLASSLSIDDHARFLTGPSTGATGTWQWALARPDSFTGFAPIAGRPSLGTAVPDDICRLVDVPMWVAHSEADPLQIEFDAVAVAALEACGSTRVQFITYEDLGHLESVRTAYAGPDLYDWMLAQVP